MKPPLQAGVRSLLRQISGLVELVAINAQLSQYAG